MSTFKEQCISLRKDGHTLPEIIAATGRPKTSVYHHIRTIPLDTWRVREIKDNARHRARLLAADRKGKSSRDFKKFSTWNKEMVCLVAHFLFDGEIRYEGCVYNNRSKALLDRVEHCMLQIYEYPPKRYRDSLTGVLRIAYFNVALAKHVKERSLRLIEKVPTLSIELKREFVRAFFDDEGCMDYRPTKNARKIRGYQKKVSTLYLIRDLLSDFGISARVEKPNEVVITGRRNLLLFQQEIGFSSEVCINGNRSNSIWKESLEKRVLLHRAIASYR